MITAELRRLIREHVRKLRKLEREALSLGLAVNLSNEANDWERELEETERREELEAEREDPDA